jgi:EmrB/QacA subfamily drug resistance transporter
VTDLAAPRTPAIREAPEAKDPARWATLAIVITAAFIIVLDNTVLNVAIPTILHDLDTTLPSVEWVITGYALTFATLLIIGGRLGDIYGHRRIFMIGLIFFAAGSFLAAVSQSVHELILGEAVIEGIGASLMLPTTLAIISDTFHGRERATAFAAWGATAGVASALGPVVGGFLTSNYSWRWSFGINVVIAPLALVGAWMFIKPAPRHGRRLRIDVPGAALVAVGMFLLVFSLSEGATYGWWKPISDFTVAGHTVWSTDHAISIIPLFVVTAVALLGCFYVLERWKERNHRDPLFEFSHLSHRTYKYGLLTGLLLGMGQLGLSFVLPQYLQTAEHLTAEQNGLWLLPTGIFVILGAQIGARLIHRWGTTVVVRVGLIFYATGIGLVLSVVSLHVTFWELVPGFALYGMGIGFAGAQLTNVVLSDIPQESSGSASGANTTVRQVGMALGVAVIGALLTTTTINHATKQIEASNLPPTVQAQTAEGIHSFGVNYVPPASTTPSDAAVIDRSLQDGIVSGTRTAMTFAMVVVAIGVALSFLIPNIGVPETEHKADPYEGMAFPEDDDEEDEEEDEDDDVMLDLTTQAPRATSAYG